VTNSFPLNDNGHFTFPRLKGTLVQQFVTNYVYELTLSTTPLGRTGEWRYSSTHS